VDNCGRTSSENDIWVLMRRKGFEFAVENDVQGFARR